MDTLDESVQSIDGTSGKLMFTKKGFLFKCLMVCNDSQSRKPFSYLSLSVSLSL